MQALWLTAAWHAKGDSCIAHEHRSAACGFADLTHARFDHESQLSQHMEHVVCSYARLCCTCTRHKLRRPVARWSACADCMSALLLLGLQLSSSCNLMHQQ